jgi:hypothetical protein
MDLTDKIMSENETQLFLYHSITGAVIKASILAKEKNGEFPHKEILDELTWQLEQHRREGSLIPKYCCPHKIQSIVIDMTT